MKILLIGKDGQVGWELQRSLSYLGGDMTALGRYDMDLKNLDKLRCCIRDIKPDVVVNAAAYTLVDKAESEPEKVYQVNSEAVGILTEEIKKSGSWLVHYSTDYVFDGEKCLPYEEDDQTKPLSVYGKSKLKGEQFIRESKSKHLIFRTGWVYSARGHNFLKTILRLAKEKDELKIIDDQYGAPTSAGLIADVTALALFRIKQGADEYDFSGIYHLAASGKTNWHGFAQYALKEARTIGVEFKACAAMVKAIASEDWPLPARRPKNSCLNTFKLREIFDISLPDWHCHVKRVVNDLLIKEIF